MNTSITINEERLKNTFIKLVGVPCPSCDEKQEAELLVKKLQELGMEPQGWTGPANNAAALREMSGDF